MHKLLILFLLIIATNTKLPAQPRLFNTAFSYEYYIRLSGINSRQDVEHIQDLIGKKPGVSFFMANRYPVRYFLMRSDHLISANEFEHFLNNPLLSIQFYGEGKKAREEAVLLYNKTQAQ